jgi:hypothetical protein
MTDQSGLPIAIGSLCRIGSASHHMSNMRATSCHWYVNLDWQPALAVACCRQLDMNTAPAIMKGFTLGFT